MAQYHDTTQYGYYSDDDDISLTSSSTVNNNKKIIAILNKEDRNCFRLKRKNAQTGKLVSIMIYSSGDTGSCIRDAITGTRNFEHIVGTNNEELYFKAGIATGEIGKDSKSFFFESPEQYERHMHTKLPENIKKQWQNKNFLALRRFDYEPSANTATLATTGQRVTIVK